MWGYRACSDCITIWWMHDMHPWYICANVMYNFSKPTWITWNTHTLNACMLQSVSQMMAVPVEFWPIWRVSLRLGSDNTLAYNISTKTSSCNVYNELFVIRFHSKTIPPTQNSNPWCFKIIIRNNEGASCLSTTSIVYHFRACWSLWYVCTCVLVFYWMLILNLLGVCIEYLSPYSLYFTVPHRFPWSPHGVLMESLWTPWGLHPKSTDFMESPWILGELW